MIIDHWRRRELEAADLAIRIEQPYAWWTRIEAGCGVTCQTPSRSSFWGGLRSIIRCKAPGLGVPWCATPAYAS